MSKPWLSNRQVVVRALEQLILKVERLPSEAIVNVRSGVPAIQNGAGRCIRWISWSRMARRLGR